MDLKCPGSGMMKKNRYENIEHLGRGDEVKFVIADEEDYLWAVEILARYNLPDRCGEVLFSPVFGRVSAADLARWILRDTLPVRMQLQMHKFIWNPEARGV
jgi:7-carboxy-7-deazaguanine synthase